MIDDKYASLPLTDTHFETASNSHVGVGTLLTGIHLYYPEPVPVDTGPNVYPASQYKRLLQPPGLAFRQ
jgi:hypothetical protein